MGGGGGQNGGDGIANCGPHNLSGKRCNYHVRMSGGPARVLRGRRGFGRVVFGSFGRPAPRQLPETRGPEEEKWMSGAKGLKR